MLDFWSIIKTVFKGYVQLVSIMYIRIISYIYVVIQEKTSAIGMENVLEKYWKAQLIVDKF